MMRPLAPKLGFIFAAALALLTSALPAQDAALPLGSAKFLGVVGKGLAEAMAELKKTK